MTGLYFGSVTFGKGEPNETTLICKDLFNMYIACYQSDGTFSWARSAGGLERALGSDLKPLSDDSIAVTGLFSGTTTFGKDEVNETNLTSAGDFDIFIARYNPDGTLEWAKRSGGENGDGGSAITILSDNSIVITGKFSGDVTFGEGEPNETTLEGEKWSNAFIAKYDSNGTLNWVKYIIDANGNVITTLSDDSVVMAGRSIGEAIFEKDTAHEISFFDGNYMLLIARYHPDGTLLWAKSAIGLGKDSLAHHQILKPTLFHERFLNAFTMNHYPNLQVSQCIAPGPPPGDIWIRAITSLPDDSIVVTGTFEDVVIFAPDEKNETVLISNGHRDIFIARYNPDGTLNWAKSISGKYNKSSTGITSLSDGTIVIIGHFGYERGKSKSGKIVLGEDELNQTILKSTGKGDMFIAYYNMNGTLISARHVGRSIGYASADGISKHPDDSMVLIGTFDDMITFRSGQFNETELSNTGEVSIFIARFEP